MKVAGVFTALVTPFTADGKRVALNTLRAIAEEQIRAGVHGLVVLGSTGEHQAVTPEERQQIIAEVVDVAAKRVPVVAGTGASSTAAAVQLTQEAKDAGCDGCMVVSPFYVRPTQRGLVQHFTAVANVGLPAMEIASLCDITLFASQDSFALPMMAIGATGVMSILSNFAPERVLALTDAASRGDFATALKVHAENYRLSKALFLESSPTPTKQAMELLGKCSAAVREPLTPCSDETIAELTASDRGTLSLELVDCELPSLFASGVDALSEEPTTLSPEDLAELLFSGAMSATSNSGFTTPSNAAGGTTKRKPAPRRNPNKARDGRKAELAYLRKSVSELEARLEALRSTVVSASPSSSAAASGGGCGDSDSASPFFLEKFLQFKAATATARHLPYAEFPNSESDAEIFRALLAGVEQAVAEIDAIFEANGLAHATPSGLNAQSRVDSELGRTIEICATKELPFGVHETGAVVWNHYQFAKRSMPCRFYTYHAHKSVDATDDTTVEDFTLELHAKNTRQRCRSRQMIRRSVSEDRYVIVWRTFFDPIEHSDERLSGIRFMEKGYVLTVSDDDDELAKG
ncbi:hypothetical protein PybrP1_008045 [[Pythium] brassicae (nom. inval.)]|nr:hypothetical protein PybrP1_008045 [[Pythium] brassicae (nom. inval.)]